MVESAGEFWEVGFTFAEVDVVFGLEMDFADRVVTEFLEGGVYVFAAPHHVAGVVIHFDVGGISEALEEFEDAVVGDGRFDAESDAVFSGDWENFLDELGHASDFLFAFLEIGGAA